MHRRRNRAFRFRLRLGGHRHVHLHAGHHLRERAVGSNAATAQPAIIIDRVIVGPHEQESKAGTWPAGSGFSSAEGAKRAACPTPGRTPRQRCAVAVRRVPAARLRRARQGSRAGCSRCTCAGWSHGRRGPARRGRHDASPWPSARARHGTARSRMPGRQRPAKSSARIRRANTGTALRRVRPHDKVRR